MSKTSDVTLPVIAVTAGDPAGIGPEICLSVLADPSVREMCRPVVFGDAGIFRRVAAALGKPEPETVMPLAEWKRRGTVDDVPTVVDCAMVQADEIQPGRVQAACGKAAFGYIKTAIEAALQGQVAAVTTAPINKEALKGGEIPFPGHTEIFGSLTGSAGVCMMLASDVLTVSMVTTHVGFIDVPGLLSPERVAEVICLTASALENILGRQAKLGVCGLNPHAGEHGLFGRREEELLIVPGIELARKQGFCAEGPFPPDTVFVSSHRARFDAIVCMYHDQGHIPFKMLAFDKGVNITLGTSVIRTSVDHGTAFDIAWKGKADPTSMLQALKWAVRLAAGRKQNRA